MVPPTNNYRPCAKQDDLSDFVKAHGGLIKKIASHLKCKLPANTDFNDLTQAGLIGLLEAKSTFSATGGASFETYAAIKIRGAMIDELRKNTGITRDISQNMKSISLAKSKIENSFSPEKMMTSLDVANQMGISEKKYMHMTAEINAYQSISMSDMEKINEIGDTQTLNPVDLVEYEDALSSVKALIGTLPKREQQVLALYYNEQLNFKEIAEILGLTEARISQIHSITLAKVRKKYTYVYNATT